MKLVGWLADVCQLSKKKLDGGGSQKVLVITESIRRLVIEVHRIVAPALALSSSEHIVRREAKVQLAMAEWMSLSMVVYCLFGLIISGGNSAKVASAVGPSARGSGS